MPAETKALIAALIDRNGSLFSQELGIDLSRGTPSPLFRWLCASLLLSSRISHSLAMAAAEALSEAGWTTAEHMAASTWKDRVAVLNEAGYGRYDESTARMLGETADALQKRYGGDLRKLREDADRDPKAQRKRLLEFSGIGSVGADIFFREMQGVWPEHYPFADRKAIDAAARLGLPDSIEDLSATVERSDFPRLVAALVRAELDGVTADELLSDTRKERTS